MTARARVNLDSVGKAQVVELAKRGDLTQAEIGKRVGGISQGRVSQILAEAGWPGRYRRATKPKPRSRAGAGHISFHCGPELGIALRAQADHFDRTLSQELALAAEFWLCAVTAAMAARPDARAYRRMRDILTEGTPGAPEAASPWWQPYAGGAGRPLHRNGDSHQASAAQAGPAAE